MAQSKDKIQKLEAEIKRLEEAGKNQAQENRRLRKVVESVGKQCNDVSQSVVDMTNDSTSDDETDAAQSKSDGKGKSKTDGGGSSSNGGNDDNGGSSKRARTQPNRLCPGGSWVPHA